MRIGRDELLILSVITVIDILHSHPDHSRRSNVVSLPSLTMTGDDQPWWLKKVLAVFVDSDDESMEAPQSLKNFHGSRSSGPRHEPRTGSSGKPSTASQLRPRSYLSSVTWQAPAADVAWVNQVTENHTRLARRRAQDLAGGIESIGSRPKPTRPRAASAAAAAVDTQPAETGIWRRRYFPDPRVFLHHQGPASVCGGTIAVASFYLSSPINS